MLPKRLIQISVFALLGVAYLTSIYKPQSDSNHHWLLLPPPIVNWLVGPSEPVSVAGTVKKDVVDYPSTASSRNSTMTAMNVPKLRSTLKFKFRGETKYLGVVVDAGRHYFPVPWLEALLHYMAGLGYNWLHLRLTDDQVFAVRFESHPDLAVAAPV